MGRYVTKSGEGRPFGIKKAGSFCPKDPLLISSDNAKVRREIGFYFWTGTVLYLTNTLLNVIDFYQRVGWDLVGYLGFVCYFAINFLIILHLKRMKNWARNLFIVKFAVFALVFYPQTVILQGGSWMYSNHLPHGVFQRISNFGNFAYELFFVLYLIKRTVRFAFIHP